MGETWINNYTTGSIRYSVQWRPTSEDNNQLVRLWCLYFEIPIEFPSSTINSDRYVAQHVRFNEEIVNLSTREYIVSHVHENVRKNTRIILLSHCIRQIWLPGLTPGDVNFVGCLEC